MVPKGFLKISEITEKINGERKNGEKLIYPSLITDFLLTEGFLIFLEETNQTRVATSKGNNLGIISVEKKTLNGEKYLQNYYSESAIEFIRTHIDEVQKEKKNDFKPITKTIVKTEEKPVSANCSPSPLFTFKQRIDALLSSDIYINKKSYSQYFSGCKDEASVFKKLQDVGGLNIYCEKGGFSQDDLEKALACYDNIESIVETHNKEFIAKHLENEKIYFDEMLQSIDPKIKLDEEQRTAVLTDEDYCLVIAGAGAGKTTTVAAKVKYLVEKRKVYPQEILVISFTNKAVDELKERINKQLGIPAIITTFHSTGNAIIRKESTHEKLYVAPDGLQFNIINKYLRKELANNPRQLKNLILFFGYFMDAPFEEKDFEAFFAYKQSSDFSTMKGNLGEFNQKIIDDRKKSKTSIKNERLRSFQEVQIANFLYLHGIDYEYEKPYPYHIPGATKLYTPDFYIKQNGIESYIEHFGISEAGENTRFSAEELEKYKKSIQDKINIHREHGTNLITTYSKYNDRVDMLEHLRELLVQSKFVLTPVPDKEVFEKLSEEEGKKYFNKFVQLLMDFIGVFKINGYGEQDFFRLKTLTKNVRTNLFLDLAERAYLYYQTYLKENNAVDFSDMINESIKILSDENYVKKIPDFKYVIVDEYQDISRQRFDLAQAISSVTQAKVVAVGDDWQSIFAFAGSDVTLFTHFCKQMGYGKELKITNTYRNAQELIDIAGDFVQQNPSQIKKSLKSPKHINEPVVIFTYSDIFAKNEKKGFAGVAYEEAKKLNEVIGKILALEEEKKKGRSSILLIGRFSFDAQNLGNNEFFDYDEEKRIIKSNKYSNVDLTYMTAHSSKGLGFENVIIINAADQRYGFPAQIETDPVLKLIIKEDREIDYSEERRLFYVALTRTKNRVFILAPETRPSKFVLELLEKYPNVSMNGAFSSTKQKKIQTSCPICGYPIQLKKSKAYGLSLYMCTNDPEICDFMTNNMVSGKESISFCDQCEKGFLIVKRRGNDEHYFFGCTNYTSDKKGCNNVKQLNSVEEPKK